jgi:hypothetical protein
MAQSLDSYLLGCELSLLDYRDTTPANYPQANGKLERLHKEIGKLCRVHKILPDEAIMFLQTPLKKTIFLSGLKLKFSNESNFICSFKPDKFNVYDFVF